MDSKSLTREEFEDFSGEGLVQWLRANARALKTKPKIIKIIEENDLTGEDLLEMTPDHVKEMIEGKKMGPRIQLEILVKKLNKMFEKPDTKEPPSHVRKTQAFGTKSLIR
eukprot:jgi/Bigna1/145318/aug1.97_g20026